MDEETKNFEGRLGTEKVITTVSKQHAYILCNGENRPAKTAGSTSEEMIKRIPQGAEQRQVLNIIRSLLRKANDRIYASDEGETAATIIIIWEGESGQKKALIGNVGDSKVCHLRKGEESKQITREDTQLLGKKDAITPQLYIVDVEGGDKISLESGGIHLMNIDIPSTSLYVQPKSQPPFFIAGEIVAIKDKTGKITDGWEVKGFSKGQLDVQNSEGARRSEDQISVLELNKSYIQRFID